MPENTDSSSDFSGDDYDDYGLHGEPVDDEDGYGSAGSGYFSGEEPDDEMDVESVAATSKPFV